MAKVDDVIPANGYSSTVRKTLTLGKDGTTPATVLNPLPVDAIVTVDSMDITAEMNEATGHDYYVTTTNVGDGTLTISFDSVAGLALADIVTVENKTNSWVYNLKNATVAATSILLVAASQATGYPVPGITDEFEIVYRGTSRLTDKTQMAQITDGTTEVDVIATENSLKTDVSTVVGTATNINGGNRDAGTQTVTLADDDPATVSLALIDDTVKTLGTDTYTEATSKGLLVGVVRNDAGDSLVDTDGEITSLQVNAYGMLNTNFDMIRDVAPDVNAGDVSAGSQRVTLATDDINAAAIKVSTEIMDDWDATEDSAIGTDGAVEMLEAKSAQKTAVADGDAVIPVTSLNGEQVIASYTWATNSNRNEEIDPVDEHYVEEELVDTTDLSADTYYYPSSTGKALGNFNNVSIHGVTTGGVTVTVEAKIDDSTDWVDITPAGYRLDDNTTGNASFVDQTFILDFDELHVRNIRIKSITADATNGVQYHWKLSAL